MEKSLENAAIINTIAANNTNAKVAMPARRAVSPRRSDPAPLRAMARIPARNEYALSARARRSAKLPISDMGSPAYLSQIAKSDQNYDQIRNTTMFRNTS